METKPNGPRERYDRLVRAAQQLPPVTTAVAHPCDRISIEGVVEAAQLGLIAPILVGPPARIREAAQQAEADISSFPLEESAHSHDSAAKAVELVRQGKAEALMKGSLHTDELMGAVVARETGIRTARRISHCFVMDVPGHKDPLIITDAAVNIAPSLADKVDIVQNAIDLGHALGFPEVRVAIMSAMETVNPAVPSTIEAAALCKMAERGQITGGILDGPLALDNAINEEAAAIKHIVSPVAGRANVLVVPDLESGNMLAKSLSFLAGAAAAGIVLGARVPIILTSRADSVITRLASCAVASLVAEARRTQRSGSNPMTEANSMPPELTRSSILKGQKALIVGVANDRSIAWGCAQAMHRAGAEIAMTYLNDKARPYVEPLASAVEASLLLPLEVRDTAQVDALFEAIASKWGRLDILVHSIAFAPRQALEGRVTDCPRDGFLTAMDVSCWSLLDLTRRAEKLMTGGGTIFAMSYHGANEVIENYGIMGPVKAALESAVRYLAAELGPKGIRVHAISPGPLATRAASGIPDFDALMERVAERAPARRLVTIEEVGAACVFLASRYAGAMTGDTIYIDGGYHILG